MKKYKYRYNWEQFDSDVNIIVRKVKDSYFSPKTIVCIATGGLSLGAKLHNLLDKPLTIISAKSYMGFQKGSILLNCSYTVPLKSPILLVDEITDTGKTISLVKEHLELGGVEVKTVTLFYKEHSSYKPDWYIRKVADKTWVKFPWE